MKFGTAREIITPYFKMYMSGYSDRNDYFMQIHDDLFAKALVLDDGHKKLLIISLDIGLHSIKLTNKIRCYTQEKYEVDKTRILINYTHTHAGPATDTKFDFDKASNQEYEKFLLERIKTCIDRCFANIIEGTIYHGAVKGDWSINRRLNQNGKIVMAPNLAGATDRIMHVLQIRDTGNNVRCIVVNYGCHPVTLGPVVDISAEYPGRLCALLDSTYYGSTTLFLQGAAGNVRPRVTANGARFKKCSYDEVDDMAHSMTLAIGKLICSGTMNLLDLSMESVEFKIPLGIDRQPKEYFEKIITDDKADQPLKSVAARILETYDRQSEALLGAGAIKLTEKVFLVHIEGEACAEVKQRIAEEHKDKEIIFLGYTNDDIGYIPNEKIIDEGGYEGGDSQIWCGFSGKFKKGIDHAISSHIDNAIREIE